MVVDHFVLSWNYLTWCNALNTEFNAKKIIRLHCDRSTLYQLFLLHFHSSEIWGLGFMKWPSEMLQNLPYFCNTKIQIVFFVRFSFRSTLIFSLMIGPGLCRLSISHIRKKYFFWRMSCYGYVGLWLKFFSDHPLVPMHMYVCCKPYFYFSKINFEARSTYCILYLVHVNKCIQKSCVTISFYFSWKV